MADTEISHGISESEKILKAARKQIFTHGVRSLQLHKLAKKLGMSVKAIYTHYHTKSLLVTAVMRNKLADMDRDMEAIHSTNQSFSESIRLMLEVLREHALEYSQAYIRDMLSKANIVYFEWVRDLREEVLSRHLVEFFELGQRAGEIRKDVSVTAFKELYLSMTNGLLIGKLLRMEKDASVHDIHKSLFTMVLEGVLVRCECCDKPTPPKKKKPSAKK